MWFSLFFQQPPKQPTSPSNHRTRWLWPVSRWLYLVSLWVTGEWYSGPKMALHWVERETYQVTLTSYFCVCLSFCYCFLCVYCSLCLCRSCRDQCQVSLETKSFSVNCWGFTQMNGERTMYCRQVGYCCTHRTLICCLAFQGSCKKVDNQLAFVMRWHLNVR